MLPHPGPGKLIVLEGLDGAGTTTQARLLGEWLRAQSAAPAVHVTWEPTDSPVGLLIRRILTHQDVVQPRTLAALFVADRLEHLYRPQGVAAQLRAGAWVVMDRYYLSSLAYQSLSLMPDEVGWLYEMHAPCLRPDVTFFLDVPVTECLARIRQRRVAQFDLFEKEELLIAVLDMYHAAIRRLRVQGETIHIVDGGQDIFQVTQSLQELLDMR